MVQTSQIERRALCASHLRPHALGRRTLLLPISGSVEISHDMGHGHGIFRFVFCLRTNRAVVCRHDTEEARRRLITNAYANKGCKHVVS